MISILPSWQAWHTSPHNINQSQISYLVPSFSSAYPHTLAPPLHTPNILSLLPRFLPPLLSGSFFLNNVNLKTCVQRGDESDASAAEKKSAKKKGRKNTTGANRFLHTVTPYSTPSIFIDISFFLQHQHQLSLLRALVQALGFLFLVVGALRVEGGNVDGGERERGVLAV